MARGFIFIDKGELNEVIRETEVNVQDIVMEQEQLKQERGRYEEPVINSQIPHIQEEAEKLVKAQQTDDTTLWEIGFINYL